MVRPHERAKPQRFARGGKVRKAEGGIIDKLKSVLGGQFTQKEADAVRDKELAQAPPPQNPPKKDTIQVNPKGSTVDTLKNQRDRQMKELGLRKGGRVKHKMKTKVFHGARFPAGDFDSDGDANGDSDSDGMRRGGKVKRAMGGPVKASKGGMRKIAKEVVKEHVNYPAPKGHKGLKGC
jgi:hypothetical protein